jgi:hypothetical protein
MHRRAARRGRSRPALSGPPSARFGSAMSPNENVIHADDRGSDGRGTPHTARNTPHALALSDPPPDKPPPALDTKPRLHIRTGARGHASPTANPARPPPAFPMTSAQRSTMSASNAAAHESAAAEARSTPTSAPAGPPSSTNEPLRPHSRRHAARGRRHQPDRSRARMPGVDCTAMQRPSRGHQVLAPAAHRDCRVSPSRSLGREGKLATRNAASRLSRRPTPPVSHHPSRADPCPPASHRPARTARLTRAHAARRPPRRRPEPGRHRAGPGSVAPRACRGRRPANRSALQ